MTDLCSDFAYNARETLATCTTSVVAAVASLDQTLGYSGDGRFVLFYFEPRLNQVQWQDGRQCGSGPAGWPPQFVHLREQAKGCGISIGDDKSPGDHVLLVDRLCQQARFAYREEAQDFLARLEPQ